MINKDRKNWVSILEHGSIVFNSETKEIIDVCSGGIFKSLEAYSKGFLPCYVDRNNVTVFNENLKSVNHAAIMYATKESIVKQVKNKFEIADQAFAEFVGEQCLMKVNGVSIDRYISSLDGDDLDDFVMDYAQKGGSEND